MKPKAASYGVVLTGGFPEFLRKRHRRATKLELLKFVKKRLKDEKDLDINSPSFLPYLLAEILWELEMLRQMSLILYKESERRLYEESKA